MSVAEVLAGEARSCVEHAKCEAFAPTIPDGSVNMLWLDPPYFRVVDEEWDRAWKTEADFLAWLRGVVREAARVLAPNGSLYLFASPQMASRVECITRESLNVLNHIVWPKNDSMAKRSVDGFRSYVNMTERVIFAENFGADSMMIGETDETRGSVFEPLRAYLDEERKRAGVDRAACNVACGFSDSAGGMASRHYFSPSQWQLPTAEHYASLRRLFNASGGDYLRREYDSLRREYDSLRREFSPDGFPSDVWEYETTPRDPSRHPCEKPLSMLRDVVRCSSRPNDVVCEFFGGSFRMAEVALSEGRRYIGCDADEHWAGVGVERARAAERGTVAAVPSRKKKVADDRQPSLFGGGK